MAGMGSAEFAESGGLVSSERQADKHTGSIAMTEWHGIKVGGLYKRTGRGAPRAPLAIVVGIELSCHADRPWTEDGLDGAKVSFLEAGGLHSSWLIYEEGEGVSDTYCKKWPYKEVSV